MKNELIVCLLAISSSAWSENCVIGSRVRSSVTSPDGRYRVLDVSCLNRSLAEDHVMALVLRRVSSPKRRILYTYTRAAHAVWSPDSRWIAINDYAGSDYTNNLILSIDPKTPSIDLKKKLLQAEGKQNFLHSDHLYLSAGNWKSGSEVELLAWGHDSARKVGFCRCFLVSLEGATSECRLPIPETTDPEEYCDEIKK